MDKGLLYVKLGKILRDSEILMREIEEERDESLENLRFDGEEEVLTQYYKRILTSIYRMRNNSAALLLKNYATCSEADDFIGIFIENVECKIPKQALKNVLQKDYDTILKKNICESPNRIILGMQNPKSKLPEDFSQMERMMKADIKMMNRENKEIVPDFVDVEAEYKQKQLHKDEKPEIKRDEDIDTSPTKSSIESEKSAKPEIKNAEDSRTEVNNEFFGFFTLSEEDKQILEAAEKEKKPVATDEQEPINTFGIEMDFEDIFNEAAIIPEPEKTKLEELEEKKESVPGSSESIVPENLDDISFGFHFDDNDSKEDTTDTGLFRKDAIIFRPVKNDEKSDIKPKFTTEASTDDPDDIMRILKANRDAYDKIKQEQMIEKAQKDIELSGTVFDLSTGSIKKGDLNVEEAIEKIDQIADSVIRTSRKDKLMDVKIRSGITESSSTYKIQGDSDFSRDIKDFVLDCYHLKIRVMDEDGIVIREDTAKILAAPIAIPENGSSFVTDICTYLESNGESHGAVVRPGGKTTIVMRCEDYSFFIRGSWEQGNFASSLSVLGNGIQIDFDIDKKEIRPKSMENIGIGHNIIILDHATTIHIIPAEFENSSYGHTKFMAVISRDYGIDQDAECMVSGENMEILVNGERYKYCIRSFWDEKNAFNIESKVTK